MVISWTSLCFFLWVVLCAVEAGLPQYWTTSSSSTASLSTTSGLRSSRSRGNQQASVLPPPLDTSTERKLAEMRLPWQVKVLQKVWSVSPSSSSSPSEASSTTTNGGGGSNTDHSDGSSASGSSSPSQGSGLGTNQMTILNEEGDELTYFPSSSANRRSNPFLLLLTKTQQSLKKLLTHPKLIAILIQMKDWSQDNVQKMIVLMKNHKSTALLAGKIVFGVYLSVLCLRRLLKWYHGITQHELLLDHNDYLYQSFGGVYDHIGSSFLSTCNASYVTNSQSKFLQQSYQRLTTSLNRPCFPHTMKSYTQYIHRDIIVLLKDVVMLQTTSVIVLDSSNAAVSSASMPSTASSQPPRQADSSTVEHINDSTAVITTERTNPAVSKAVERQALEEGQLQYVQQLQRGILYLQYRQSDVYLRMIRLILLTTVNQIEELLQYWTQVVMKKSRTFRLFFLPTFLFQRVNRMRSKSSLSMSKALHKIQIHSQDEEASTSSASSSTYPPQQDASNEDIDMMLSHLNAREKVVLLQNLRDHMYAQLGEIQTHLDSAALIMTSLGKHFEDSLQRSQPNSDDVQVKNQRDGKQLLGSKEGQVEETQTWQDLRDWVEESSSLASHALSVISMRSKLHHAPSNHSPHFMQMFANPNTTVVHEASISVVDNNQTIATVNATDAIAQNGTEAVSSRWTFFNIFPRTSTLPQVDSALPTNVSSGIAVTATRQRSTAWAALTYPFSSAGTFVSNAIVAPTQTVLQQAQSQVQKLVQAVVKVGDEEEDPNSLDDHNQHHRVVEDLPATVKGSETEAPEKSSWMSSLQHSNLIPRRSVVSALKPSSSPSLKIVKSQVFEDLLRSQQLLQQQSSIILQDIPSASSAFQTHCVTIGLIPKSSQLLWLSKKYIKLSFRLLIWMSIAMAGLEINKQRRAIKRGVTFASKNMRGFVHRRFVMPTMSIVNDVIFNKRTAITDKVALKDAKRSLNRMIYDFLVQHYPKMNDQERKRIAAEMDMSPISKEYEKELKQPIQHLLSGRIARIVLIQLQFVKKELLVAMEAIDELFNANQVNLQMLAVTPAVLALLSIQNVWRLLTSAIRATSRGRVMESISMVHRDIRMYIREMERVLLLADADNTRSSTAALIEPNTPKRLLASPSSKPSASKELQLSFQALTGHEQTLSSKDMGRLMSLLYRIQLLLLVHASNFEVKSLNQFQEDLRDITTSHLSIGQRLQIIERIYRVYSFMQPSKGNNLFGGGLLQ